MLNILKAEIEKKRKLLEEKELVKPNKKFFKRAELVAKEAEEYRRKCGVGGSEEAEQQSDNKQPGTDSRDGDLADDGVPTLPRKEVVRRLRERGEPVLLFGETELESFRRLRRSEILEPEVNRGLRNDFQEALEKVDQAFLDEILASSRGTDERAGGESGTSSNDVKVQDDGMSYEEIQRMATDLGKGDRELDMQVITHFIQFLLKMWGHQLNSRSQAEKMTVRGKLACATYTQTQVYLKPLLRKLKTRSVPEDIAESLTEITRYMLDRDYIRPAVRNEVKRIINNIVDCCQRECERGYLLQPLTQSAKRTVAYTGVSISTVRRIRKFCEDNPGKSPETPGKRRPKSTGRIQWDDFDRSVVRQTIEDFYLVYKMTPSLRKLRPLLKEKIGWSWSTTALWNTLRSVGFTWRERQNKRSLLLERGAIICKRSRFIEQMRYVREAHKEVFYLNETWIDSNLTVGKCWHKDDRGIIRWGNSSKRLIIGSVGSRKEFVREAQLLFWAKSTMGDYHGEMNSENFEKWFKNIVLPNLPPKSVIVLDNAPYHSRQVEKTPRYYDTKLKMLQWLRKRGLSCNESMRKLDLFSLIQQLRPTEKSYVIDELAKEKGHVVVRLPPYNSDLSAVELAWVKVKKWFRKINIIREMPNDNLLQLVNESLLSVTADDWEGYYRNVKKLEEVYWKRDVLVELAVDDFITDHAESDSSDNDMCTDEESSNSDSD